MAFLTRLRTDSLTLPEKPLIGNCNHTFGLEGETLCGFCYIRNISSQVCQVPVCSEIQLDFIKWTTVYSTFRGNPLLVSIFNNSIKWPILSIIVADLWALPERLHLLNFFNLGNCFGVILKKLSHWTCCLKCLIRQTICILYFTDILLCQYKFWE